jgi:hypothetical protein
MFRAACARSLDSNAGPLCLAMDANIAGVKVATRLIYAETSVRRLKTN